MQVRWSKHWYTSGDCVNWITRKLTNNEGRGEWVVSKTSGRRQLFPQFIYSHFEAREEKEKKER